VTNIIPCFSYSNVVLRERGRQIRNQYSSVSHSKWEAGSTLQVQQVGKWSTVSKRLLLGDCLCYLFPES
jgi:hypothetical protein